ncbi:hypothetical protein [Pontibacter sp. G13]|uniref:hypothetical protein n=1 Tax=Pontibacter sp. G13 TaxID=3074898 RepID=UPI00288AC92F|nr:hypothetical protein [Pontibacter sp. G13]WNJ17579.1 hypothetical protein RJD25_22240 [Pontibacter sp. G13]
MDAKEISLIANRKYYEACIALKGRVKPEMVDFDSYAYFRIDSVPQNLELVVDGKIINGSEKRVSAFQKLLSFKEPDDLNLLERKKAPSVGCQVVRDYLNGLGFECRIDWSFRD